MCVEGHAMPMGVSLLLPVLFPGSKQTRNRVGGKTMSPEPVSQKKYLFSKFYFKNSHVDITTANEECQ